MTGGSESLEVLRSGRSILVSDASGATAPDVREEEFAVMARLGARSYLLVPLLARGRVLGAFTLLSTQAGRHYTAADLEFAETSGGRFALAIDNARLHDAASRSLALLDTMFATAPVGLAFLDRERRYVRINAALAAMNGRTVEEHLGRTADEVLGATGDAVAEAHRTVVRTGQPVLERELERPTPRGRRTRLRHWVCSFTPVHAPEGELLGVSVVVIDITERRRMLERQREALEAERAARARADLLSRAGRHPRLLAGLRGDAAQRGRHRRARGGGLVRDPHPRRGRPPRSRWRTRTPIRPCRRSAGDYEGRFPLDPSAASRPGRRGAHRPLAA